MMARNMHSSGAFSKRLSGSLNSWRQIRWLRSCRKYTRVEDKTSHQLSDKSNPLLPNAMFFQKKKKKGSIIILINTILSQAPSIPRHTPIELNPLIASQKRSWLEHLSRLTIYPANPAAITQTQKRTIIFKTMCLKCLRPSPPSSHMNLLSPVLLLTPVPLLKNESINKRRYECASVRRGRALRVKLCCCVRLERVGLYGDLEVRTEGKMLVGDTGNGWI